MPILKRQGIECANRLKAVKTDRYALLSAAVCLLLFIIIIYSMYVRVRMYMLGISLWNDEAWIAENIVDRTMAGMLTPPLANLQSAPALHLVVIKSLTLLFGTSEAVLRVLSFVSLIAMLIAQGILLRKVFHIRLLYTIFSVAVSSTFLLYMEYSNELKPYMGDAACVFIVLLGYYAYREGLLGCGVRRAVLLGSILSVCILFSSPIVFLAAAVLIVEFILKCKRKDRKALLHIVLAGVIIVVVFLLNYFLWLRPIVTDEAMVEFWTERRFDFLIYKREAIAHNLALFKDLLLPVWHAIWLVLPFAVFGFIISLVKRNVYTAVVGLFLLILLFASAIDKYPIQDRLWLFIYVLIFIYAFLFINAIKIQIADGKAGKLIQALIPLALAFLLLVPNMSFPAYGKGEEWTLRAGNQASPIISYLEENIEEGEMLYSYISTNAILKYKNGYDNHRIGNVSGDNIIFGTEDYDEDIERIVASGGSYVFFYHSYYPFSNDWYIDYIVKQLQKRGFLEQVMNVYHTYLYWFTDDLARARASASLEIYDLSTDGGLLKGVAHIDNTGGTILAPEKPGDLMTEHGERDPDRYGRLYVVLHKDSEPLTSAYVDEDMIIGEFKTPVLPGEFAEILVNGDVTEPGEYIVDLVAYGMYVFSGLGTVPVQVSVARD